MNNTTRAELKQWVAVTLAACVLGGCGTPAVSGGGPARPAPPSSANSATSSESSTSPSTPFNGNGPSSLPRHEVMLVDDEPDILEVIDMSLALDPAIKRRACVAVNFSQTGTKNCVTRRATAQVPAREQAPGQRRSHLPWT